MKGRGLRLQARVVGLEGDGAFQAATGGVEIAQLALELRRLAPGLGALGLRPSGSLEYLEGLRGLACRAQSARQGVMHLDVVRGRLHGAP